MTGRTLLLLSGGLDSTSVAATHRPDAALFIDYGQMPAEAELAAARHVADHLELELLVLAVDLSEVGAGLLIGSDQTSAAAPTAEWFPYRNQFLITVAAAYAVTRDFGCVAVGLTHGDGDRHADGTTDFIGAIDRTVSMQEGGVHVSAPAHRTAPEDLVRNSSLPEHVLRRTHSCHTGHLACGQCPGCARRRTILEAVFGTAGSHMQGRGQ